MEHTAKSLVASPNPQVLELRILTHHAGDARFSFLKGRYKGTWEAIKRGDKPVEATTTGSGGLGGLMGGYDSDESDDGSEEGDPPLPPPLPPSEEPPAAAAIQTVIEADPRLPLPKHDDVPETPAAEATVTEEEKQARELRKEKAKAWMAARRQERLEKGT
jgi:hypothetical protein